jgi:O-antigen/teichoic acid export membrane protein
MSLRRIAKTGSALLGGQGVSLVTQLLLPPLFLRSYTIAAYGDWLTLTAAVTYLANLNFGIQTFANNQVTIHYNRGELDEATHVQATTLALLLAIIGAAAALMTLVFFLPINDWLRITTPRAVVSATIYLLALQVLGRILFGFFIGMFLVVGISYRGTNWSNAQGLVSVLGSAVLVFGHVSFVWIAAQQLLNMMVFCILAMIDFRLKAPTLFPRLRYAQPRRFVEILKPSGYFGILYYSFFLVYQLPVIFIQRILGPTSVVVFTLTRTIYGMSRQSLTFMSWAIGPEITELYGKHNWKRLFQLYELSERVIFALVPVTTIGTLLATPLLMVIWLHKPNLYDPHISLVMAVISGVIGIKEHKIQFQTSSNEHTAIAKVVFFSYLVMVCLAVPGIHYLGVLGFIGIWLATELIQVFVVLRLNQQFFANVSKLDYSPVYKLFALMGLATTLGAWFAFTAGQRSLLQVALIALVFALALAAVAYPLFDLAEVRAYLKSRSEFLDRKTA